MENYTWIHLHTELSLLDSCTNYKLYIDKAKEFGMRSIAFTEHGNLYQWIAKKIYCDENGIKYIHGCEVYLTETLNEKVRDNYHTILLAKNYEGVKELNMLVGLATDEKHKYYKPRISFDEFFNISDNIIKISACMASPLNKFDKNKDVYKMLCESYDYYEIQPHNSREQIEYNLYLKELSLKYNKPITMGTDIHAVNKYKQECRSILQKAKKIQYEDEDLYDLTAKNYKELIDMCKIQNCFPLEEYKLYIENTNIIANSIEDFEIDKTFKYPKLYNNDEEIFKKMIKDKYEYKIKNKIITKDKIYLDNIKEEFRVFKKLGMISFMLFMSELTTWCIKNKIPLGNCRGSIGGSTIAYILDIIDLNPVKWKTVFSRFCNEERQEIGDIDLDFSPSQRELVYNYIIERFGKDYTSYILAIGTISDKGTIDEIGRALNYPLTLVDSIKKEYEDNKEATIKKYSELFYYFEGLINTTISQSIHPAGIIASPITLNDNYGLFYNEGKHIININMEEVHDVSLVKYDILGLKNIEILKDTCNIIGCEYPLSHNINWEDENVWNDIISSSIGIFQFEGNYAFSVLKQTNPKKINDMSIANACLRPSGESYRDRLLSGEINKNPSEIIDNLLKDNRGYLIFQEDVTAFLQQICGLSGSEADNVRRAIGRKQVDRLNKALPSILEGYCKMSNKPRHISEEEAKSFLKIIEDASSYMFGYNHSTGYSMIGYLCGYYRYYYPIEFITAYINNAKNNDDINGSVELAKLKNINIYPIKYGKSGFLYTMDKKNNSIYKGLNSIKFINENVSNQLGLLYDNKYLSFLQILHDLKDTSINSNQLEILIKLDYFSEFGKSQYLLDIVKIYEDFYNRKQISKSDLVKLNISSDIMERFCNKQTEKLYKEIDNDSLVKYLISELEDKDINLKEKLNAQKEYIGYIEYINEKLSDNFYYVLETKFYQNKTKPYLKLYRLKDGNTVDYRINEGFEFNTFKEGDIIKIIKEEKKNKNKLIDGKWTKVEGEFNNFIKSWQVL